MQFSEEKDQMLPEDCKDTSSKCESWSKSGECDRNPGFMRGDSFSLGACRRACGECEVCTPTDRACKSRNRVRAGYLSLDQLESDDDPSATL